MGSTSDHPLTEPAVLAATKQRLFPPEVEGMYAVTDTQFATDEWRHGTPIDDRIRSLLSPFNHVRLGSGYPDLVGIGAIDPELIASTPSEERVHPLVAVEAKGYAQGSVDIERGIVQAYDRLTDANLVYLAVPETSITNAARSIARDLNVGLLGVTEEEKVTIVETPRIVGSQSQDVARTLRFQATAQGVTGQSFTLNHPKNYLAYPIAVYHPEPTPPVMERHVVAAVDGARNGAAFLGLILDSPPEPKLTTLGEEVVRYAIGIEGSVDAAIKRFDDWKRSTDRFVDIAGSWGALARWVVFRYPATELLISELQRLHDAGNAEPTLPEVVTGIFTEHPTFAVELFIRGTDEARRRVFSDDSTLDSDALNDPSIYASPTVFQLKAMLYHAGLVSERGAEPARLEPNEDVWALRTPL